MIRTYRDRLDVLLGYVFNGLVVGMVFCAVAAVYTFVVEMSGKSYTVTP